MTHYVTLFSPETYRCSHDSRPLGQATPIAEHRPKQNRGVQVGLHLAPRSFRSASRESTWVPSGGRRNARTEANERIGGTVSSPSSARSTGTTFAMGRARSRTSITSPASARRKCSERWLFNAEMVTRDMTYCDLISSPCPGECAHGRRRHGADVACNRDRQSGSSPPEGCNGGREASRDDGTRPGAHDVRLGLAACRAPRGRARKGAHGHRRRGARALRRIPGRRRGEPHSSSRKSRNHAGSWIPKPRPIKRASPASCRCCRP